MTEFSFYPEKKNILKYRVYQKYFDKEEQKLIN